MPEHFGYLDENSNNDIFPKQFSNQIYISQGSSIHFAYRSVYSIKYVFAGSEFYEIGNKFRAVKPNQYLIVNNGQDVLCLPDAYNKGISVFIDPALMADVFKNLCSDDAELLLSPSDMAGDAPLFFEGIYRDENNSLNQIFSEIQLYFATFKSVDTKFAIDLFYQLARAIIISQKDTFHCLNRIMVTKRSTRDELFRRMITAKNFLYDNWRSQITIAQLAKVVFMSPFHFHRTFKSTFGITPTQYQKKIRMQKAKELMTKSYNVTEVAAKVGYEDVFSFSKAFKKSFGVPPSQLQV